MPEIMGCFDEIMGRSRATHAGFIDFFMMYMSHEKSKWPAEKIVKQRLNIYSAKGRDIAFMC